jgi:chromosome partitioning protein
MRTIAIINQKGGCGKTTVAVNLAAVLAAQRQRTLLVDMDPQGHCALGLSVPERQITNSIAELLVAGLESSTSVAESLWQVARGVDLLPATMNLAGVEQRLAGASDKDRRLAQVLGCVSNQYDFCVIDCPPSIGLLTFNALRAADEVIVPVETGYFALQGAIKQQQTIELLARRVAHHLKLHVLATMYDPNASHTHALLGELQNHFSEFLLPATIHYAAALQQAASFGQPVTEFAPASQPAGDFASLARWLIEHPPTDRQRLAPSQPVTVDPSTSPDQPAPPTAGPGPGRSRAAELVERARQLSARTAELSRKMATEHETEAPAAPDTQTSPAPASRRDAAEPASEPANDSSPLVPSGPNQPASPWQPAQAQAERPAATATLRRSLGARATHSGLLFVQPIEASQHVAVVGDFNDWDPSATPLQRDDRLGVWQKCVPAPAGRYRYLLVVDGAWQVDQYNADTEPDAQGRLCNVVTQAS